MPPMYLVLLFPPLLGAKVFDQNHLDIAKAYVPDIEDCMAASKSVLESDLTTVNTTFVRFYESNAYSLEDTMPNQLIFVAADSVPDDVQKKYYRIAAVFQAYSALDADAALVTNFTNFGDSQAMVTMCLSASNAHLFVQPFEIQNNTIIWKDDDNLSSHVDEFEFDQVGNDIISMYYHFTHLDHVLYSTSEVYSFLSTLGIIFTYVPGSSAEVDYFDFSNLTEEQHKAIQDSFV